MRGVNTFSWPGRAWAGTRDFELPVARPEERGGEGGCTGPQAAVALDGECLPLSVTHPAGAVGQSRWFLVEVVLRSSVVLSSRRTATKRYAGWTELSWVGLSLGRRVLQI